MATAPSFISQQSKSPACNGNEDESCSDRSHPIVGSVEYLERCRAARQQEQEIARREEKRLQEILTICEEYNRECEKFFQLEQKLNPSTRKIPAKYIFTPRDKQQQQQHHQQYEPSVGQTFGNNQNHSVTNGREPKTSSSDVPIITMPSSDERKNDMKHSREQQTQQQQRLPDLNRLIIVTGTGKHDADHDDDDEDDEEELKVFQALENEVNLTESIAKSLTEENQERDQERNQRSINNVCSGSSESSSSNSSQSDQRSERTLNRSPLNGTNGRSLFTVPLAQSEDSTGSLGTPNSDETMTATSSRESNDRLLSDKSATDFSSMIISIHESMRMKRGKASSLPPSQIYSVPSHLNPNQSLTAFDSVSIRSRDRIRASSVNPSMSRSTINGHFHANNGLLAEMQVLGHNVTSFSPNDLQISCCTCSGHLWKLCSDQKTWKKRFFHFDRYHRVFFYYQSVDQFRKVKKPNGGVGFIELKDVYINREKSRLGSPLRTGSDPRLNRANDDEGINNKNQNWYRSIRIKKNNGKNIGHRDPKYASLLPIRRKSPARDTGQKVQRNNSNNNNNNSIVNQKKQNPSSSTTGQFSDGKNYVFNVETSNRLFILRAPSYELMRLWVDVIFTGVESYFG